jgi:molybdate transport system regulatory protein
MEAENAIKALIQLRKGGRSRVGPDRIRLLEVVQEKGSIMAAARELGLSYKGAWDAIQATNNLFEQPLVVAQPGGRTGGAAVVTPVGQAVILAYRKVETELAGVIAQLEEHLADGTGGPVDRIVRSLTMKTSARNVLRGTVEQISEGAVNAEVVLKVTPGVDIVAIVTRESVKDLALAPGAEAMAIIKSSFVILAKGEAPLAISARNRIAGTVVRHEVGAVNDEVVIDIGEGKTITATITRESGQDLGFAEGERAQALVKASHVILAVD